MVAHSLDKKICELLREHPDALDFGGLCSVYHHALDDLVDEPHTKQDILKVAFLAKQVYNHIYYLRNQSWLHPILNTIHHDYCTSVEWENSPDEWKRKYSDVLRATGNNLAIAMVQVHCDYDTARNFDLEVREASYQDHHDTNGNPI